MESIPQEFIAVIRALGSNDTQSIKEAEERFNAYKQQPDQLITCLLFITVKSEDNVLREYTSVLIRPLVTPSNKKTLWENLSDQTKDTLKIELLNRVQIETSNSIRHKIVDIIGSMAPDLITKGRWNELLPFLIDAAKCQNENLRESSYLIIGQMAMSLGDLIKPQIQLFKELMGRGLNDDGITVRIASLKAITQFLSIQDVDTSVFESLLPMMLSTITAAIHGNQEKSAQDAIFVFIVICEIKPSWFRSHIELLINTFFQILLDETVLEETRHYVLEFFLMLAEKRPSAWKKNPQKLGKLIEVMFKWLSTVDEISLDVWNNKDTDKNDAEDNTDADVAQDAFDRLSLSLGKVLVPIITKFIPQLIRSPTWGHRYAALMSLTMVGEGLGQHLKNHLSELLSTILVTVNDPNPRVKWALFFCLGQMASDYGEDLKKYDQILLQSLASAFQQGQSPRVQAVACLFLTTFLEDSEKKMISPYAADLFTALMPLLESKMFYVAENALAAFSSVIECIGDQFIPYYDKFMPFLVGILTNHKSKESRTLRGRAMEAISLIGLAVKKEKFAVDLDAIMNFMAQQPAFESDDPQVDYFLRACTRFCQCLGRDFSKYLNFTMRPLIEAVKAKVEITVDDDEYEHQISEVGVIAMDNKALALSLLAFYAEILEELMYPYLTDLTQPTIALLDYEYNEEIRVNATSLIPNLLQICKANTKTNDATTMKVFEVLYVALLGSAITEVSPEIISGKLRHASDCIEIIGDGAVTDALITKSITSFKNVLESLDELKDDLMGDVDEEDEDPQNQDEIEYILDAYNSAAALIGDIVRFNKERSIPFITTSILSEILERLADDGEEKSVQASMICILDDICEYGGQPAYDTFSHIIPPMIKCTSSTDVTVRHASAYGLGIAAQCGKERFSVFLLPSLQALNALVSQPSSKEAENLAATDNAVSAIGRFIRYMPQVAQFASEIIPLWLKNLPLEDESETVSSIENLIEIIKMYPEITLGQSFSNLPHIKTIIDNANKRDLIQDTLLESVKQTLASIKTTVTTSWNQLPVEAQNHLRTHCADILQ